VVAVEETEVADTVEEVIEDEETEAEVREVAIQISQFHQPFFRDSQCHWLSITSDLNSKETSQKSTYTISILAQESQVKKAGKKALQ
jgi:hypothetical protein